MDRLSLVLVAQQKGDKSVRGSALVLMGRLMIWVGSATLADGLVERAWHRSPKAPKTAESSTLSLARGSR
ncbi:hypothetical protein KFU94_28730 [Chloroflexi bacterium TSY]|nr:hypothetical protein [Chloroflexi bacterium TSY]